MKKYDPSKPLIFIHIPKSAGTTVKSQFKEWYGNRLYEHYFNEVTGTFPRKVRLKNFLLRPRKIVIYGHFNRNRGFGITDYYPEVDQFVTVLRDPFESAVSAFYYKRNTGIYSKDKDQVPKTDLETFLKNNQPNILNHFPVEITVDNYKEIIEKYFIAVGITEMLQDSIKIIGDKLGFPVANNNLPKLNETIREETASQEMKAAYESRYPLEFLVYRYCYDQLITQAEN